MCTGVIDASYRFCDDDCVAVRATAATEQKKFVVKSREIYFGNEIFSLVERGRGARNLVWSMPLFYDDGATKGAALL